MNIRIEKRLPFGFKGEWGKCYKLTNYNFNKETLKKTTWKFKDQISRFEGKFYINFITNGNVFCKELFWAKEQEIYLLIVKTNQSQYAIYDTNVGWINQTDAWKTIEIIDGEDITNETLYNWLKANATLLQGKDYITYSRATYFDIGFDVQFKHLEDGIDKVEINSQPIQNLITKGEYRVYKTTDAYFNKNKYDCVVSENDIIFVDNDYWIVEKVETRSLFNPAKQDFYYIYAKKIFDEIITGAN